MHASADSREFTQNSGPERRDANALRGAVAHCPHLGIVDDPATAFAFATPANHCFSSRRPDTIELHHQQSFCLTDRHTACPLYQEAINNAHGSAPVQSNERLLAAVARLRKALAVTLPGSTVTVGGVLASTLFALLLFGLLYIGLDRTNVLSSLGDGSDNGIVQDPVAEAPTTDQPLVVLDADPTATPSPSPTAAPPTATRPAQAEASRESEPSFTPTATATPSMTPTRTTAEPTETSSPTSTATEITPTATATRCVPPSGWVTYVVQPGENLYRIGLRYNLGVNAMMEANCLDSESVYSGQTLYVPFRTPVYSASPTPVEPVPTTEPPPPPEPTATSEPPPPPPPPEDTPTSPPPTATPPMDNPPPTPTAPLPSG